MNLLLLEDADFDDSRTATVVGERLRHLRKVLRVEAGDRVRAGRLDGLVGHATVLEIDRRRCRLELKATEPPPPPMDVSLVLALPRPKFLGRILQATATMGVKQITLVDSQRVEKSFWQSQLLETARLRRHLLLGLAQGRDTVLPRIEILRRWQDFLEGADERLAGGIDGWVADGDAEQRFEATIPSPSTIVVGPEGGLLECEIEQLCERGYVARSLGPRPLRVETAVAVLLGRVAG